MKIQNDSVLRFMTATLEVFCLTSRRTGRTSAMLNAAQPGDCIIVANERERHRLRRQLAREDRDGIDIVVIDPMRLAPQPSMRRRYRAIHFDHDWLEQYYQHALRAFSTDLYFFTQESTRARSVPAGPIREASHELSRFKLTDLGEPFMSNPESEA